MLSYATSCLVLLDTVSSTRYCISLLQSPDVFSAAKLGHGCLFWIRRQPIKCATADFGGLSEECPHRDDSYTTFVLPSTTPEPGKANLGRRDATGITPSLLFAGSRIIARRRGLGDFYRKGTRVDKRCCMQEEVLRAAGSGRNMYRSHVNDGRIWAGSERN